MSTAGTIVLIIFLLFFGFIAVGGYIQNRDRHWRRIWEKIGRPDVDSIKKLKVLLKQKSA